MKESEKPECIFCTGHGPSNPITGEHLWSDWMATHLPIDPNAQTVEYSEDLESETSLKPLIIERTRQRVANAKKIHAVCLECNTRWMSNLERKTKRYLLPLLQGKQIALDDDARTALARFLAMKIMVVEHDAFRGRKPMPVYGPEERQRFRLSPYVPDGMRIWIAPAGGPRWRTGFNRYVGGIRLTKAPPGSVVEPNFVRRGANIQSVTWGIGRFVFHAIATTSTKFQRHFEWEVPPAVIPIWPLDGNTIYWPPNHAFTDWAIDEMARALHEISKTFPRISSDGTLIPRA